MPEKQTAFTVTDRRKFTYDGELRDPSSAASVEEPVSDLSSAAGIEQKVNEVPAPAATPGAATPEGKELGVDPDQGEEGLDEGAYDDEAEDELGPMPTSQELAAQQAAYQASAERIDDMIRASNPGAPPTPPTDFEQIVQSFYLSAAIAMGAATEPGQKPRVDIIGARQSIDMLAVLGDKTKGNLSGREHKLLQTAISNLRLTFLDLTNSIALQAAKAQRPTIAR